MKHIFKKSLFAIALLGISFAPNFALAADPAPNANPSLKSKILKQQDALAGDKGANLGAAKDPRVIAADIIKIILTIVGTLITVYFIYGGYLIMTAGGAEDQVAQGKDTIKNAVIGLFIVLAAYSITTFVTKSLLDATSGTGSSTQPQTQPIQG